MVLLAVMTGVSWVVGWQPHKQTIKIVALTIERRRMGAGSFVSDARLAISDDVSHLADDSIFDHSGKLSH
jgi:hypothetical protein